MSDEKVIAIDGDYFYAGIVAKDGKVIAAAPIIKYMIDWDAQMVFDYCKKKKFKIIK